MKYVESVQRERELNEEKALERKVFHADEDDGEVEVPQICPFLLNDRCVDGEEGRCQRLHATTSYHWQVRHPETGKWINLSKIQSFELEKHFADPINHTPSSWLSIGASPVSSGLLLAELRLFKANLTGSERKVRRRPAPPKSSPAPIDAPMYKQFPSHWIPMSDTETCRMVAIDSNSQEYRKIASLITCFNIRQITRVQNPYLWEMYQNKKSQLLREQPTAVNEMDLFHGTSSINIISICLRNFDWRLHGSANGSAFGKGVYFTSNPQTAAGYCRGGGCIFVVKVLVGNSTVGNQFMTHPPAGFHSTTDSSGRIIVKYHDQDYYPLYVVES
ncbi:unnamed protein product [Darwinula stevensoni]|uniref:Poly [ADP-ribose] polymerase n=1 Tax=Darwinula stevensoni TaxID=69355 RepID=A0A7R8X0M8_9CRUS|nr:unnamed protein product [Darwinula stevensoni]CAG0881385.1 unnamed protein product [Darwinula stevensoni]